MEVSLIAAVSVDGVIGNLDGGIPWPRLPRDIQHFRDYTKDKFLLLGRRTYEEMVDWFRPGHVPLVVSSQNLELSQGRSFQSVEAALDYGRSQQAEEIVVCGGGETYRSTISFAGKLLVSRVHVEIDDGVFFPEIKEAEWQLSNTEFWPADEENTLAVEMQTWLRRR